MNTTSSHSMLVESAIRRIAEIWDRLDEDAHNDLLTIALLYKDGQSDQEIIEKHLHTLSSRGQEIFLKQHGADQSQPPV